MSVSLGNFQRLAGAELPVMRCKPPDRSHATGAVPLWTSAQGSPVGLALTSGSHDAVLRSSKAEAIAGRPTFLPCQHTASSPHRRHVAALSSAGSCQDCPAPEIVAGELPLWSLSAHSVQCAASLCPVDRCSCNDGRPFAFGRIPCARHDSSPCRCKMGSSARSRVNQTKTMLTTALHIYSLTALRSWETLGKQASQPPAQSPNT